MRFFFSPGSCALASHIALHEARIDHEAVEVNLHKGANNAPAYRALNPLGRVPALALADGLLTENAAILNYIADQRPERALLPAWGGVARARAIEWMSFLASIVHPCFRSVFKPERFLADADDAACDKVRRGGLANAAEALRVIEQRLDGRPWALGERYSLCDAHLLVFFLWAQRETTAPHLPATPGLDALAARVWSRPAAQAALAAEGLGALDPFQYIRN